MKETAPSWEHAFPDRSAVNVRSSERVRMRRSEFPQLNDRVESEMLMMIDRGGEWNAIIETIIQRSFTLYGQYGRVRDRLARLARIRTEKGGRGE
jgi:hypothetical protein